MTQWNAFLIKGTHNQSQRLQTKIIKTPFSIQIFSINLTLGTVKDRHPWWGREFWCSLLLNMDKLFPKAIINVLPMIANDTPYILI